MTRFLRLSLALAWAAAMLGHNALAQERPPLGADAASSEVVQLAQAAFAARDHQDLPFAIVDKKNARLFVYDAGGTLRGSSAVLLGLAHGDHSVPGIGERKLSQIRPDERTTPAGRFVAEPGRNSAGEDIVWVDYDAAISMHRVRATNPAERRLQRLASPSAADNRISYGCIYVPAAFYEAHVQPVFGSGRGIVYVLPEASPMASHFAFLGERPAH